MSARACTRRSWLKKTAAIGAAELLSPVFSTSVRAAEQASSAVRDIGSRVEMFVDRWLIEREEGVALRLHPPVKREIVLTLDRPWEGPSSAYYTVFRDAGNVRLYYRGSGSFQGGRRSPISFCFAHSKDGVAFERPALGQFAHGGSTANNIVFQHEVAQDSFTPFLDTNPAARPEQRYKALVSPGSGKIWGAASPDGLRWSLIQPQPISEDGAFDSLNVAYWDAGLGQYRMFSRFLDVEGQTTNAARNRAVWQEGARSPWCRAIQSNTSRDFLHWSPAVAFRYAPGVPKEHFYTNATIPCPGAEHVLLAFPKRFREDRTLLPKATHEYPGVSDAAFMSSRDGIHWDRTFLEAWVRPGRDPRNWSQRSNMVAWGIIETADDEFSMYISEHYEWNDNRLRRMTIRRHGFASVQAGARPGVFLTKPLRFQGGKLHLNFSTSIAGCVRVELQSEAGQALPGRSLDECLPIFGDDLARTVEWKSGSDVAPWANRPLRLKFELTDADLFAIQFLGSQKSKAS